MTRQRINCQDLATKVFLQSWHPYLWIVSLGLLIYWRTLFFGLSLLDDYSLLKEAHSFLEHHNFFDIFVHSVRLAKLTNFYRPLLTASFIFDDRVGGGNPVVFHLTNLILHLMAAGLFFLLLQKLAYKGWRAFVCALIFTAHPAATNAVAWIPGRNDSLLTIFVFASFICLIEYLRNNGRLAYIFHLLFFALALLTKETAIVAPLLFILYSQLIRNDRPFMAQKKGLFLSWALITVFWLLLKQAVLTGEAPLPVDAQIFNLFSQSSLILPVMLQYLGKAILPFHLLPIPLIQRNSLGYGFGAIAILTASLWLARHKRPGFVAFGLSWFVLFLLPTFVSRTGFLIENRLYLPIFGVFILVLETDLLRKKISVLAAALLIMVLSVAAFNYSMIYAGSFQFWEKVTKTSPRIGVGHLNLANLYLSSDQPAKAEAEYTAAVQLLPKSAAVWYNLSLLYCKQGKFPAAETACQQALSLDSNCYEAYNQLGIIYARAKRYARAKACFERALGIDPSFDEARFNLELLYQLNKNTSKN